MIGGIWILGFWTIEKEKRVENYLLYIFAINTFIIALVNLGILNPSFSETRCSSNSIPIDASDGATSCSFTSIV